MASSMGPLVASLIAASTVLWTRVLLLSIKHLRVVKMLQCPGQHEYTDTENAINDMRCTGAVFRLEVQAWLLIWVDRCSVAT